MSTLDGTAGQYAGAVWDQPLPWAAPQEGAPQQGLWQERPQPQPAAEAVTNSPAAEPQAAVGLVAASAAAASSAPAEVEVEAATASMPVVTTESAQAGPAEVGADTAGQESAAAEASSVTATAELPEPGQQVGSPRRRSAHAAREPLNAGAVGGRAVPKGLLGAAVAAGGLLAAIGGVTVLRSHPSAATVRHDAVGPILPPAGGTDTSPSPKPPPTSPSPSPVGHAPVGRTSSPTDGAPAPQSGGSPAVAASPAGIASAKPAGAGVVAAAVVQQTGYLSVGTSVDSTNPSWSQSTVTVTTTTRLTALKIVVRLYQTGGVVSTGTWSSLGSQVTVHSAAGSQEVDYVVTLNAGVTLNPGTYTFEFQYNHSQGTRDTGRDIYAVVTTAPGSAGTESKQGNF